MTPTSLYTEDALVQGTAAEYLEQRLGWKPVYARNNKDFRPGKIWHWYERWVDVVRKHCWESGGNIYETGNAPLPNRPR